MPQEVSRPAAHLVSGWIVVHCFDGAALMAKKSTIPSLFATSVLFLAGWSYGRM